MYPYPQSLEGLVTPVRRCPAILELGSGAEVLLGLCELPHIGELFRGLGELLGCI